MTTWGLSATIRAPAAEILRFAAHHLQLGAHRLYIYLDEDNPDAYGPLKAHPKVRVTPCTDSHWQKLNGARPRKHQPRQTLNATHAYARADVDWLIHMDVDEFLIPDRPVETLLPLQATTARVRPMELLAGSDDAYKAFVPTDGRRRARVNRIYPTYGRHLKGGFLSHVAGKLFVRTGLADIRVQIHNVFQGDTLIPGAVELPDITLAHRHAKSWDAWRAQFDYRHAQGSYRSDMKPALPRDKGGMSIHELFQHLLDSEGDAGLRHFYDEVIGDSPALRARLQAEGLLRIEALDLDRAVAEVFPEARV